jgi:hypothetical protein
MDLKETGRENTDWIHVAQDKVQFKSLGPIIYGDFFVCAAKRLLAC